MIEEKMNIESEALVVSAFFDLKRESWENASRSLETYFNYFDYWARLNNPAIFYVSSESIAEKIVEIRSKYGLKSKTYTRIIDYRDIEPELYSRMRGIAENKECQDFRMRPDSPETHNAEYDLIMLLKAWALNDAAISFPEYKTLAWIDFGFGHGNETFTRKEDFEFTIAAADDDLIHMFAVQPIKDIPIVDIVSSGCTYISGSFFYCSRSKTEWLWENCKANMQKLLSCGMIDDDQTIWLMCFRDMPEYFSIIQNQPLGSFHVGIQNVSNHAFSFSLNMFKAPTGIKKIMSHIGWGLGVCMKYFLKRFWKFAKILFI